ncbi:MAG: homoserine kinase [Solobacterium sp.]|nr:homoserine kinase [Solobacterium sp.]
MIKLRVPATSANLGPGFDCLGIALGVYNTFEVEPDETLLLEGVEEHDNGEDNLFVKAFRQAGGTGNLHVKFEFNIPNSRGLGSSASLYTGGALAAMLMNQAVDIPALFQIVSDLEGHPDNAAPSVFGGMRASMKGSSGWISRPLPVSDLLRFTVMIPDYQVHTEDARAILPDTYPSTIATSNTGKGILLCQALQYGDIALLKEAATDQIHEPYRRTLIPNYELVREIAEGDTGGVLVISGSGSTLLLISDRPLSDRAALNIMTLPEHWAVQELPVCGGPELLENGLWQEII